ncbi:MAG: orotidine 5'-phosphate decarboxylase, partial [Planctomycetota bacterium]
WMEDAGDRETTFGSVGLVVGATYPDELAVVRKEAPRSWILLPGLGVQGGSVSDVVCAFDEQGLGALASSSRGIIYAYEKDESVDWTEAVAARAQVDRDALEAALAQ